MNRLSLSVLVTLFAALLGCTPKAALAPMTPPVAPPITAPITSSINPDEVAWAKVVQAAKKEGKVTAYTFFFMGDLGSAMADAFYKKYGIRVELIAGPGAGLSERVRTEQRMKNVTADVLEGSAAFSIQLLQEGYVVTLSNELPVLKEDVWLAPPALDDGGNILRHALSLGGPWVNTDLVKPDQEPKSWTDLLYPRWKGTLLSNDPRTSTNADRFVHMLTRHKIVEPDFFPRLTAQRLTIPTGVGPRPPFVALARGEGAILVFGSDGQGSAVMAEGGHIKPIAPREGLIGGGSTIMLVKNAPHPNAGKLFSNFVLSREGHELVTRIILVGPVRKDVPDHSVYASLKPFKIFANTIEDEDQINKNFRDGVAAKVLGVR